MKPEPEVAIWKQLALLAAFVVFCVVLLVAIPDGVLGLAYAVVLGVAAVIVWSCLAAWRA